MGLFTWISHTLRRAVMMGEKSLDIHVVLLEMERLISSVHFTISRLGILFSSLVKRIVCTCFAVDNIFTDINCFTAEGRDFGNLND